MSDNWTDLLLQFFTFRNPSLLHQAIRAVEGGDNLTIDLMDAAVQFHSVNDQSKDEVLAAFLKSLLGCYSNAAWGSSVNPGIQGEALYQHFCGSKHRREASVVALALEDVQIARLESQRKSGNIEAVKNIEAAIAGMERAERIAKQLEHGPSIAFYLYKRGHALNELTQWKAAKDVFVDALKIYQQLQQTDFDTYAPLVADIFHQIAIICFNLRELQDAIGAILKSKNLYERLIKNNPKFNVHYSHIHLMGATFYLEMDHAKGALNLFEMAAQNFAYLSRTETDKVNMAWGCLDIYEFHAIRAIQGMGNALVRMKKYAAAHEKLGFAINYFRHIIQGDSELCTQTFVAICTPHLAECLSLRALAYTNSNKLLEAESIFAETLSMYRHLNNQHPGIYTNSLVEALKLRGKVLGRLNKIEEAQACFDQAIELIEPAKEYWFIKADIYLEMGYLAYSQMQDNKTAYDHFSKCIEIYEGGIREIEGRLHRDILKTKIESAYHFLIDHYAHLFAMQEDTNTFSMLVNLCEALRQREALSDIGLSLHHDEKDLHTVAKRIIQDYSTSLIIVTLTFEHVHFIIIGQDGFKVCSQSKDWFHRFTELQDHFQNLINHVNRECENGNTQVVDPRNMKSQITPLCITGQEVFRLLPNEVKQVFRDDSIDTIFLSLCGFTINLPWELLQIPIKNEERESWDYLGLRKVLPRFTSIPQLAHILERQPRSPYVPDRSALVVGNPLHHGLASREDLESTANTVARSLSSHGYGLLPHDTPITGEKATGQTIDAGLNSQPDIWIYLGHGGLDLEKEDTYLCLANHERLTPHAIATRQWSNNPFIHFGACFAGAHFKEHCGSFKGYPIATLHAGASCVLSSVHQQFSSYVEDLAFSFFGKILSYETFGDALLQTRQELAQLPEYQHNPLVWSSTVLWGNPYARLVS